MSHANAPLTKEGRRRLCERVDAGRPRAHVAAEAGISRQCLSKWHARWRGNGEAGLQDRASRPGVSPNKTPDELEDRIEKLRRERKLGPARIGAELRANGVSISDSAVHRVLERRGISRLRDLDRPTGERMRAQRYERGQPCELVHVDVKKLGKIRPGGGWWAHGRGSEQDKANHKLGKVGYDYVHVAIDDRSRLAFVEVLPDEKGATCAEFLTRAGAFFASYGISISRVMSDNAFAYRKSTAFRDAVAALGAEQRFIKPHCPWTNGKAERFNQTLALEWAYATVFDSSQARVDSLTSWLHSYNHHRPHAALGGKPPVTRVTNVPRFDN